MTFSLLSCVCWKCTIPQRYVMVALLHLALLNAYNLRVVLNIAMVEMQADKNLSSIIDACPMYTHEAATPKEEEFSWPNNIEALILYVFYIGYIMSHIPGGWLADKLGARWVMGVSMLISAIVNLLYPLSLKTWDYYGAVSLRFIIGLVQGPIYPTITTFVQCWVPHEEKSFFNSLIYSGSTIGTVTGGILTAVMIQSSHSWVLPFYVWGIVAFVWYILYMIWVYSRPITHPFITMAELRYLHHKVEERRQFRVPWMALVKSAPVWALLFGHFGHDLIHIILFTDSPKYMKEILKLNIKRNALFYSLPFVLLWFLCIFFGYLASVLERVISLGIIRRSFTFFSTVVPAGLLILMPYMGCDRTMVIVLYTLAVGLMAPFYSGVKVNVEDITTHYGGIIMAFAHGTGATAGILGTYLIGALTNDESLDDWKSVFWLVGAIATVCTLLYIILADTHRQPWDYVDDSRENIETLSSRIT